eukprot:jgi/Botrbrau1/1704/Bobra.116_2s0046.1
MERELEGVFMGCFRFRPGAWWTQTLTDADAQEKKSRGLLGNSSKSSTLASHNVVSSPPSFSQMSVASCSLPAVERTEILDPAQLGILREGSWQNGVANCHSVPSLPSAARERSNAAKKEMRRDHIAAIRHFRLHAVAGTPLPADGDPLTGAAVPPTGGGAIGRGGGGLDKTPSAAPLQLHGRLQMLSFKPKLRTPVPTKTGPQRDPSPANDPVEARTLSSSRSHETPASHSPAESLQTPPAQTHGSAPTKGAFSLPLESRQKAGTLGSLEPTRAARGWTPEDGPPEQHWTIPARRVRHRPPSQRAREAALEGLQQFAENRRHRINCMLNMDALDDGFGPPTDAGPGARSPDASSFDPAETLRGESVLPGLLEATDSSPAATGPHGRHPGETIVAEAPPQGSRRSSAAALAKLASQGTTVWERRPRGHALPQPSLAPQGDPGQFHGTTAEQLPGGPTSQPSSQQCQAKFAASAPASPVSRPRGAAGAGEARPGAILRRSMPDHAPLAAANTLATLDRLIMEARSMLHPPCPPDNHCVTTKTSLPGPGGPCAGPASKRDALAVLLESAWIPSSGAGGFSQIGGLHSSPGGPEGPLGSPQTPDEARSPLKDITACVDQAPNSNNSRRASDVGKRSSPSGMPDQPLATDAESSSLACSPASTLPAADDTAGLISRSFAEFLHDPDPDLQAPMGDGTPLDVGNPGSNPCSAVGLVSARFLVQVRDPDLPHGSLSPVGTPSKQALGLDPNAANASPVSKTATHHPSRAHVARCLWRDPPGEKHESLKSPTEPAGEKQQSLNSPKEPPSDKHQTLNSPEETAGEKQQILNSSSEIAGEKQQAQKPLTEMEGEKLQSLNFPEGTAGEMQQTLKSPRKTAGEIQQGMNARKKTVGEGQQGPNPTKEAAGEKQQGLNTGGDIGEKGRADFSSPEGADAPQPIKSREPGSSPTKHVLHPGSATCLTGPVDEVPARRHQRADAVSHIWENPEPGLDPQALQCTADSVDRTALPAVLDAPGPLEPVTWASPAGGEQHPPHASTSKHGAPGRSLLPTSAGKSRSTTQPQVANSRSATLGDHVSSTASQETWSGASPPLGLSSPPSRNLHSIPDVSPEGSTGSSLQGLTALHALSGSTPRPASPAQPTGADADHQPLPAGSGRAAVGPHGIPPELEPLSSAATRDASVRPDDAGGKTRASRPPDPSLVVPGGPSHCPRPRSPAEASRRLQKGAEADRLAVQKATSGGGPHAEALEPQGPRRASLVELFPFRRPDDVARPPTASESASRGEPGHGPLEGLWAGDQGASPALPEGRPADGIKQTRLPPRAARKRREREAEAARTVRRLVEQLDGMMATPRCQMSAAELQHYLDLKIQLARAKVQAAAAATNRTAARLPHAMPSTRIPTLATSRPPLPSTTQILVGVRGAGTAIPSGRMQPASPLRTSALPTGMLLPAWALTSGLATRPLATASAPCSPGKPVAQGSPGDPVSRRVPPPARALAWACAGEPGHGLRKHGHPGSCQSSPAKPTRFAMGASTSDPLLPSYMRPTLSAQIRRAETASPRLLLLNEARFLPLPAHN